MFIGCQFSIYPMSDNYPEVIVNALKKVTPYKVRVATDDVSTTVIGSVEHVFSYISNVYLNCLMDYDGHLAMNCLFSIGCPGEDDDKLCHASDQATTINNTQTFDTAAQFAILPLKNTDYMHKIYEIIDRLKASELNYKHKHFCSYMRGDFIKTITFMKQSFIDISEVVSHVVMTASFSNRSPSHVK